MKKVISSILIASLFLSPLTVIAQTAASTASTNAANAQAAASTLRQFNPNVNISSGNTYNGISISGIGGAIASCTNVGGFLVSAASSLLGQIPIIGKSKALFSSGSGTSQAVATSDAKAQAALASANRTTQCLDGVAYAVAKNTLAQITNKTLNWVNTGMNGNPLYVQNIGSYLNSIKNQQTTLFLSTVQNSDPIFGNALRSALTLQITGKSDGLINVSLNTPQARSYVAFQGDFVNGGWNALLNPAFNPIGSFFNAVDTLSNNVTTQQQNTQSQLNQGGGFLPLQHCTAWANNGQVSAQSNNNPAECANVTTDSVYETCCTGQASEDSQTCNAYAQTVVTRDDGGDTSCLSINEGNEATCCTSADDSPMCVAYQDYTNSDAAQSGNTTTITNVSTQKGAGATNAPICTNWVTDTPGSIIASQVKTVTNTPTQQLVYANKINEVLGSFFDSFVNNLLSKGLRGSGSGTNTTIDTTDPNYVANANTNASGNASLGYAAADSGNAVAGDFDISRPQDLRAILQTQYDFLNRTKDAQISLERIIPAIGALDYCIPGPNPDWQDGLDSNWQSFTSSIQQADPKDASTLEKLLGALPIVGGLLSTITSLFTGSGSPPPVWSANAVLSDKITGSNVQVTRGFFAPSGHGDGITTQELVGTLNEAEQAVVATYSKAYVDTTNNFDSKSTVGAAFEQADPNNRASVDGFLQDAYNETDSIAGYNQTATTIDQQYDQNVTDTQSNIEQLESIRQQIDTIVATAKARYIQQRAAEGDPVNMQCIDQAYVIDTTPITGVAEQEPSGTDIDNEADAMVQHAIDASSNFYNNQLK